MTVRESIDDFLSQQRIAVVGVSRKKHDFSRMLCREFLKRGYDVVPVNPNASELEGRRCFASVEEIAPAVGGALLMTKPAVTETAVRGCARAGVKRIWMYRAVGPGAVSRQAIDFCQAKGITVVPGYCPFMFRTDSGFIHRAHAFFMRLAGRHP